MAILPNKHLTLLSGIHYAYIHFPASNPQKPTLLFLHGFPSTSHEWRHQIAHFQPHGYGILAPDLLGYGGTSKPLSVTPYTGSSMSADIIAILDHENITGRVVAIAHDWGTYLLSQLASRYADRFAKFVFISVPYTPPGRSLDIHAVNVGTKRALGYEVLGYFLFLAEEGAGKVIGEHWESFFHLAYPADPNMWATDFAPVDALKAFITSDSTTALAPYITAEDKKHHHSVFGDDYSACLNWYRRSVDNLGVEEEKRFLKEGKIKRKISKPTLMVTGLKDAVCGAERARVSMAASVEKGMLRVVDVDAGHWIMLERAEETNRILGEFFEERNVKSSL